MPKLPASSKAGISCCRALLCHRTLRTKSAAPLTASIPACSVHNSCLKAAVIQEEGACILTNT